MGKRRKGRKIEQCILFYFILFYFFFELSILRVGIYPLLDGFFSSSFLSLFSPRRIVECTLALGIFFSSHLNVKNLANFCHSLVYFIFHYESLTLQLLPSSLVELPYECETLSNVISLTMPMSPKKEPFAIYIFFSPFYKFNCRFVKSSPFSL